MKLELAKPMDFRRTVEEESDSGEVTHKTERGGREAYYAVALYPFSQVAKSFLTPLMMSYIIMDNGALNTWGTINLYAFAFFYAITDYIANYCDSDDISLEDHAKRLRVDIAVLALLPLLVLLHFAFLLTK